MAGAHGSTMQVFDPPFPPPSLSMNESILLSARPTRLRLGEVLEAQGVISADDALLSRYEQDFGDSRRLGEILVAQGLATDVQVDGALEVQRLADTAADDLGSAEARRVANPALRRLRNVQALVMFAIAGVAVSVIAEASGGSASWYGVGALVMLAAKLLGSIMYRPARTDIPPDSRIAVVVSFYNEDPGAFRQCLRSITSQTLAPDEIWLIDDGSVDDECFRIIHEELAGIAGVVALRHETNRGKRHAQSHAFARTNCDVVVTIDSDTVLDPAAIAEGLRPFADPTVQAVTGNVRALNHRTNLLTRLIDLRYANAFLFERAAYSTVGSVVCCCGSLSFFRADVLRRHLDDFVSQTFLGVPVQYGDDRRLTQYALLAGRVVVQDTSVAFTLVPERLSHYRRQQLRWNKSFFRESLWAVRRFGPRRWPFWISLVELVIWFVFSLSLLTAIYVRPLLTREMIPWHYLAFAAVLAYARNVRYFGRPDEPVRSQIATFALAPLYAVLHVVLLTPLRLWALLTLRSTKWGTRTHVEVRTSDP